MKRIFTVTVVLMLFCFNSIAQIGVRGGVDLANLSVEINGEKFNEDYTGYYIGVFTKVPIVRNINIRPELNYFYFPKDKEENLVDQIEFPVIFELGFNEMFGVIVGPSISYLIDVGDGAKSFNYSGHVGLMLKFGSMRLESRYTVGFANLNDDSNYDITTKLDGLNIGIAWSPEI